MSHSASNEFDDPNIIKYNWQTDGGLKEVKNNDGTVNERQWYRCSNYKKPSKEEGCKARYSTDILPSGKKIVSNPVSTPHNHPPPSPEKLRLKSDVKEKCKEMLLHKMKPKDIHKQIVNETDYSTPANTPTVKQLSNMKYYLKRSSMPTPDALWNLIRLYGHTFVQKIDFFPHVNIVLAAPDGLTLLQQHSNTLFVDGTFDLCEEKLVLTTVMIKVNDIGLPVVWFLSTSRTAQNYENIVRSVQQLCSQGLVVDNILADFEQALRDGFQRVFPTTNIYGDTFHFIQANIRWMKRNKGVEHISDLIVMLRLLWCSPTTLDFASNLNKFLNYWSQKFPAYSAYFRRMWLETIKPFSWAYFGRTHGVPSGDNLLEGFNNRLQNYVFKDSPSFEAIDFVVKALWEEWLYQYKIVTNPYLQEQRLKEYEEQQKKHQHRRTLAHYLNLSQQGSLPALPSIGSTTEVSSLHNVIIQQLSSSESTPQQSPVNQQQASLISSVTFHFSTLLHY